MAHRSCASPYPTCNSPCAVSVYTESVTALKPCHKEPAAELAVGRCRCKQRLQCSITLYMHVADAVCACIHFPCMHWQASSGREASRSASQHPGHTAVWLVLMLCCARHGMACTTCKVRRHTLRIDWLRNNSCRKSLTVSLGNANRSCKSILCNGS